MSTFAMSPLFVAFLVSIIDEQTSQFRIKCALLYFETLSKIRKPIVWFAPIINARKSQQCVDDISNMKSKKPQRNKSIALDGDHFRIK